MLSQIKDNEFLQRENLLLESYLAKVDLVKIGISMEEDIAKVDWKTTLNRMMCYFAAWRLPISP
jgi:hypothetical protein